MKNRKGRFRTDGCKNGVPTADVRRHLLHPGIGGRLMEGSIQKQDLMERFRASGGSGQFTPFEQCVAQLGSKKPTSAGDDDFHVLERINNCCFNDDAARLS